MTQPISSNASSVANSSHDPTLAETGQVCREESSDGAAPEPPPSPPPAVAKLVSSVSAAPVLPPPSTARNNAERTSERSGIAPYASAGITATGDSAYAGVAVLKGHDPKSGLDVEVLSASAQVAHPLGQEEYQVALVRIAHSLGSGSASAEAVTLRANRGTHNDDGSEGYNLGLSANAFAEEATVGGATSLTYGLAAGLGAGGSIGVRDLDHDGKQELCAKVSYGPVTVGICLENPL